MRPGLNAGKLLAIAAAFAALLAVSVSIWLDPPAENRARAMDQERLSRLRTTKLMIGSYFKQHKTLPDELDTVGSDRARTRYIWHDPVTGQPFEYEITGEKSYRLCAVFEREAINSPGYYYSQEHKAGRDCLDYNID